MNRMSTPTKILPFLHPIHRRQDREHSLKHGAAFRIIRHGSAPKAKQNQSHALSTMQANETQHNPKVRRISHSAASKRFPKDFFKRDRSLFPLKHNTSKDCQKNLNAQGIDGQLTFTGSQMLECHENLPQCATPKFMSRIQSRQSFKVEKEGQKQVEARKSLLNDFNKNYQQSMAVQDFLSQPNNPSRKEDKEQAISGLIQLPLQSQLMGNNGGDFHLTLGQKLPLCQLIRHRKHRKGQLKLGKENSAEETSPRLSQLSCRRLKRGKV